MINNKNNWHKEAHTIKRQKWYYNNVADFEIGGGQNHGLLKWKDEDGNTLDIVSLHSIIESFLQIKRI